MGFGRNPHVQKAQLSEEKAQAATDTATEVRAWLEAAHLWERAADKEQPGKKRTEYLAAAAAARVRSDNPTPREGSPLQRAAPRLRLVHPPSET